MTAFPNPEHAARPPRMGPGRRAVYRPDNSKTNGFGGFILSDQMRDVTAKVAAAVAADATSSAPPPSRDTEPGRGQASYKVDRDAGTIKVSRNLRVMVNVVGEGEGVERAEFGSMQGERYRTLARAGARHGEWHFKRSDGA